MELSPLFCNEHTQTLSPEIAVTVLKSQKYLCFPFNPCSKDLEFLKILHLITEHPFNHCPLKTHNYMAKTVLRQGTTVKEFLLNVIAYTQVT